MKSTRQELWEDIFDIVPQAEKIKETSDAIGFPLPCGLEMAALRLFRESETGSPRAGRIRWALREIYGGVT